MEIWELKEVGIKPKDLFVISNMLESYAKKLEIALQKERLNCPMADFSQVQKKISMIKEYARKLKSMS